MFVGGEGGGGSVALAIIPQDPHVKLIGVRSDVSQRQMCNEPCYVSVAFGLIDCNGRPFNRQRRIPFNNIQLSGCRILKKKNGLK